MGGIANVAFGAVLDVASKPLMNAMGSVARTAADAIAESNPWRKVKNAAREPKGIFGRISDFFNQIGNTDRGRFFRENKASLQSLAQGLGITFEQLSQRNFNLPVGREVSRKEMQLLTKAYGSEFWLEYRLGEPVDPFGTGQFWLSKGTNATVASAAPPSERGRWVDHYHTHPVTPGYRNFNASRGDMEGLGRRQLAQAEYFAANGYDLEPQPFAEIVPEVGDSFFYTSSESRWPRYDSVEE